MSCRIEDFRAARRSTRSLCLPATTRNPRDAAANKRKFYPAFRAPTIPRIMGSVLRRDRGDLLKLPSVNLTDLPAACPTTAEWREAISRGLGWGVGKLYQF